ncbi:MAG TPA: GDSL-type esterase/lipase family protein [Vicinamibacterales bacterium]|nr:GDSL-type esterase/lipase family protein [Vicinamibacterales bacterium]
MSQDRDDPRRPPPVRVPPLARVALALVATLLTLGLLEAGLVLTGYESGPLSIQVAETADARAYHVFEDDNFEYDPDLIWRPKSGQSIFNRQGFRGPELTPSKPAGQLRIFTVGDSNTLGWAGVDGANWPSDLQDRLQAVRDDAVVVNAGIWGYASHQGLIRFRETLAFDPDVVLISFGSNDAHQVLQSDRSYAERPTRDSPINRALRHARLGQLVLSVLDGATPGEAPRLQPRVALDEYRANLTRIVRDGRERGVQVVLLTRPYIGPIDDPLWWKNRGADYAAATVEVADEEDVMLVDVYSFFKGRDALFADESHFTDEGHRLAADLIFEHLRLLVAAER